MNSTIRLILLAGFFMSLLSCTSNPADDKPIKPAAALDSAAQVVTRNSIGNLLDSLNSAAARADFETYFSYYTEDAIFMGTDAAEHWNKQAFMEFAKPYFDRGRAWNFSALERHIYIDPSGTVAWFDELLDTQMKICRGSGVVSKQGEGWKIRQYVLSMTIPNPLADSVVAIKSSIETLLIDSLKQK
jgi:ketosteroid isomerase-like protein